MNRWLMPALLQVMWLAPTSLHAQDGGARDPMQVPLAPAHPASSRAPGSPGTHASYPALPLERFEGPVSFMRVNGKPHLVVGTRLLGVGQMLGQERIERISETELWLRDGQHTRKLALFQGVERQLFDAACAAASDSANACSPKARP